MKLIKRLIVAVPIAIITIIVLLKGIATGFKEHSAFSSYITDVALELLEWSSK